MDIYVANIHASLEEESIAKLFEVFGEVTSTILIRDRETRISKGYGFVKMPNALEAERAIENMNGRIVAERTLVVKEAIPKGSRISQEINNFIKIKFDDRINNVGRLNEEYERVDGEENIPLEVKDEVKYTKEELDNGLVQVRFQN